MTNMNQEQFSVIDRTIIGNRIYSSNDFRLVLHEYLSIINDELKTLIKFNTRTTYDKLTFNHIYVVQETMDPYKKYQFVANKFMINLMNMNIYGQLCELDSICKIEDTYPIKTLCDEIRRNVGILVGQPMGEMTQDYTYDQMSGPKKIVAPTYIPPNKRKKNKNNNNDTNINNDDDLNDAFNLFKKTNSSKKSSSRLIPTVSSDNESTDSSTSYRKPSNTIISRKTHSSEGSDVSSDDINDIIQSNLGNNPDISSETLIKQMDNLKKIKEKEEKRLNKIKDEYDDDMNNFSKYNWDLNDQKRFRRKEKEREEERRRIFESDKRVYAMIKQDIADEDKKIDEDNIPGLFSAKYPIFKLMDEEGLIDQDDEYDIYLELYNDLYPKKEELEYEEKQNDEYVPHNYHYLNKEEQEKYKKYPSLEEVLDQISGDDSDDSNNSDYEVGEVGEMNMDVLDKDYNFEVNIENSKEDLIDSDSTKLEDISGTISGTDKDTTNNTPSFIEDKINKVVSILNNS